MVILFSVMGIFFFSKKYPTTENGYYLDLSNAHWRFRSANNAISGEALVPGDIYTDLFNNNFIPEPLFGENDQKLKWISRTDWYYETAIVMTEELKKVYFN